MTYWCSAPLDERHDLSAFNWGVDSLDQWLRERALQSQLSGTARTYVWTAPESLVAIAYFAIAPTRVHRSAIGDADAGHASVIPAYLLSRLALGRSHRGHGLGTHLLLDALERIVLASGRSTAQLVVVDASDPSLASFYAHHDFLPVVGNPQRLVMKISTARRALLR